MLLAAVFDHQSVKPKVCFGHVDNGLGRALGALLKFETTKTRTFKGSSVDIILNNVLPAIIPVFVILFMGFMIGRKTDYDLSFATDITMYFTLMNQG